MSDFFGGEYPPISAGTNGKYLRARSGVLFWDNVEHLENVIFVANAANLVLDGASMHHVEMTGALTADGALTASLTYAAMPLSVTFDNMTTGAFSVILNGTVVIPKGFSQWYWNGASLERINVRSVVGVTDGSESVAGDIGEYITGEVLRAAPVAMVNGVQQNILSVTLTPGKWIVYSQVCFLNAAITQTYSSAGTTDISGTVPPNDAVEFQSAAFGTWATPCPVRRYNVIINTPIYLVGYATFAAGTVNCAGEIIARRVG